MRKGEWHEDDRRHWGQAEQPIRQHGHANIELRVVKSSLFSLYTGCLPPELNVTAGPPTQRGLVDRVIMLAAAMTFSSRFFSGGYSRDEAAQHTCVSVDIRQEAWLYPPNPGCRAENPGIIG